MKATSLVDVHHQPPSLTKVKEELHVHMHVAVQSLTEIVKGPKISAWHGTNHTNSVQCNISSDKICYGWYYTAQRALWK